MSARDEDRNKVHLAVLVREMLENLPAHLEFAKLTAKLQRARYLALSLRASTSARRWSCANDRALRTPRPTHDAAPNVPNWRYARRSASLVRGRHLEGAALQ